MSIRQVGIIGLGLVGGSMAAALRRGGMRVRAFDTQRKHLTIALERGLIDAAAENVAEAVADAEVVVLAAPVNAILALLPLVDQLAPPDALLLDTGSVKDPVVTAMSRLQGAARAVGGHPIAGKERSGPAAACADLFVERPFVLAPSPATAPANVERAEQFVRLLGANPQVRDAAEHDRILARTSHLPQLLSTTLALSVVPGDASLAGPGLQDMTRLAASDVTMWRDILLANRGLVAQAARRYIDQLDDLIRVVEAADSVELERTLEEGRRAAGPLRGASL